MPAALIPIIAAALPAIGPVALTGAGAGFAVGTYALASVIAYSVTTAATLGLSLLLSANQKKAKGDQQQVTVKQALPARTRSYGQVKVGGSLAFLESNGNLYQLIVHGEGEWASIDEIWLNDTAGSVDGAGGFTTLPWGGNVVVESHLGSPDQAASGRLLGTFAIWNADRRLRGLCYSVMICAGVKEKVFSKVYPTGVPQFRVVGKAVKVRDPRTGAIGWSENPSACIMDLLTYERGFRIPLDLIDVASFAAFADLCDEPVALAAGGTEPRYRVSLTYELTQEPRETLRKLLQSCDGEIYPTAEGKVAIRGGAWQEPTVTLTADHILSYQYSQGSDRLAAFNKLKLTFQFREGDYQPTEIDPWEDLESQAAIGVLQQDLDLSMVPSFTQARRLGKIESAKKNPRHRLSLRGTPAMADALGQRVVRVVLDELAIDTSFFVEKFELDPSTLTCDAALVSLDAGAYAWSTADEGVAPVAAISSSAAPTPPDVTGLILSLVRTEVTGGVFAVKVKATVDALADPAWVTIGHYRKLGETAWIDMTEDGDWSAISDILADGESYEVQAAHAGFGGVNSTAIGNWSASETVVAVADDTPPGAVAIIGATGGSGAITVSWTYPTSQNLFGARIYRGASAILADAALVGTAYGSPGQTGSFGETGVPAGDWSIWVVAFNRSGLAGAPAGPVAVTV